MLTDKERMAEAEQKEADAREALYQSREVTTEVRKVVSVAVRAEGGGSGS